MNSKLLVILLFVVSLMANTDRSLYVKKYGNEKKLALVIGNANYSGKLAKLKNPVNDARDIKSALQDLGFEVLYSYNANLDKMEELVDKFTYKLQKYRGVGLFYFAGHGLEVDKKNYIVPLGANVSNKYKVKSRTISVDEIVERMQDSGTRLNMIVLDACRNDPFHRGGGGLASMKSAKGTLIAYATAPGGVASDGSGDNGLFTQSFLKALKTPNLDQLQLFKKVKEDVYAKSNGEQFPYVNDGTIGEFYFKVDSDIKYQQKRKQTSTFSFSDEAPSTFRLTINPTPSSAKVTITNIKPRYYDGIELEKGKYNIKISKKGYITKKGTINLQSDTNINITLKKIQAPINYSKIKPKTSYTNKSSVSLAVCKGCHGLHFEKHALGRSKIVANMTQEEVSNALIGYKYGNYGGPMKGVMKGQVARYSDYDLKHTGLGKNKKHISSKSKVILGACKGCHGLHFEKHALGKSKIVANMTQEEVSNALIGYKYGTYGGYLKGVMKGQVAKYSDYALKHTGLGKNKKHISSKSKQKNTWTDSSTKLMWELPPKIKYYHWNEAKNYCKQLSIDGYDDWRMPSIKELATLMTPKKHKNKYGHPHYLSKIFGDRFKKYSWIWSTTSYNTKDVYMFSFHRGQTYHFNKKSDSLYVMCVRDTK